MQSAIIGEGPVEKKTDECGHKVIELIVGGTEAKDREFPHMALIGYKQGLPEGEILSFLNSRGNSESLLLLNKNISARDHLYRSSGFYQPVIAQTRSRVRRSLRNSDM